MEAIPCLPEAPRSGLNQHNTVLDDCSSSKSMGCGSESLSSTDATNITGAPDPGQQNTTQLQADDACVKLAPRD
jgi:hypothetical protein